MDAEMNKANVKNCHQLLAAGTFISLFRQPLKNAYDFFFSSKIIFLLINKKSTCSEHAKFDGFYWSG